MTLLAIGLDSAEPAMVEELMNSGDLPVLAELKAKGAFGELDNFDVFTAELPWTTFATGVMPEETGYWTPLKYSPDYTVKARAAYEYDEYPAFFALGDNYRVCSFDVPQIRLQENLNGIQVNAWGAHSPQVAAESLPPEVYNEIKQQWGEHPGLHKDYAHALSMDEVKFVYDSLIEGIARRAQVATGLLEKERWDLFLTVFGDPHGAGHNFWQFEKGHPLYDSDIPGKENLPERPMKDVLIAIDRAIGEMIKAAPEDSTVLIFSAHGMGANTLDLPSSLFLPELLYRWHYGRPALGETSSSDKLLLRQDWGTWTRHIWNTSRKGGVVRKMARKFFPTRIYNAWALRFEYDEPDYPMCPVFAKDRFGGIPSWMPTVWYRNCWSNMKAFALASFSEGYIRINVKGREENGIVEPEDFQSVVDEISAMLRELRCARTGEPMVAKILQMRKDPLEFNPKNSDADIVIGWQEKYAADSVAHPDLGRIGPVPHFRAGSHRHTGFMLASGGGVKPGSKIVDGHALDLAPTILAMLGAQVPGYMQGKVILTPQQETLETETA